MTAVKAGSGRRRRRPTQPVHNAGSGVDISDYRGHDHPAQDWSAIGVGSTVSVTPPGALPLLGRVDAKTPDSSILWVVSLAGAGRQLLGNRDGVDVRPARDDASDQAPHAAVGPGITLYS